MGICVTGLVATLHRDILRKKVSRQSDGQSKEHDDHQNQGIRTLLQSSRKHLQTSFAKCCSVLRIRALA
jgi:hypothetical protein